MRLAWTVVIAAGCYAPVPATGVPCASNGDCPVPLVCDQARAVPTCETSLSNPIDAPADIDAPAAIDALIDSPIDAALTACLDDNFNDGNSMGWTIVDPNWSVRPNEGPDASHAFVATRTVGDQTVTHPGMRGVTTARLSVDFRIEDGVSGDFDIYLVPPGWTDPNGANQPRYYVAIYVTGGDSGPNDRIVRSVPPAAAVDLATHLVSVSVDVWHHLELLYLPNGSIKVDIDGSPYMTSPPDSAVPGPKDLLIRFWSKGAIDNVHVDCVR